MHILRLLDDFLFPTVVLIQPELCSSSCSIPLGKAGKEKQPGKSPYIEKSLQPEAPGMGEEPKRELSISTSY